MATISFDYKTFLQCTASTSKAKGTSTSKSDLQLSMQPNIKKLTFHKSWLHGDERNKDEKFHCDIKQVF